VNTTNDFRHKSSSLVDTPTACRRWVARWSFPAIVLAAVFLGAMDLTADDQRSPTVGMPARIDQIILSGSELEPIPLVDDSVPIVLRITEIYPRDTAFLYDIQYYGLEPGEFDLMDYLRRKDRSSMDDLAPLTVTIKSILPPGQIKPNLLAAKPSPYLGGYWWKMALACLAWMVGLVAIVGWMFSKYFMQIGAAGGSKRPATLAERLRPIVEDAIAGKTTETQLAALERMLIAFWRKQLKLDDATAADAITALRGHPEAGALLEQLEVWLHRPGDAGEVNVAELLKPYQNLPADALEM